MKQLLASDLGCIDVAAGKRERANAPGTQSKFLPPLPLALLFSLGFVEDTFVRDVIWRLKEEKMEEAFIVALLGNEAVWFS